MSTLPLLSPCHHGSQGSPCLVIAPAGVCWHVPAPLVPPRHEVSCLETSSSAKAGGLQEILGFLKGLGLGERHNIAKICVCAPSPCPSPLFAVVLRLPKKRGAPLQGTLVPLLRQAPACEPSAWHLWGCWPWMWEPKQLLKTGLSTAWCLGLQWGEERHSTQILWSSSHPHLPRV